MRASELVKTIAKNPAVLDNIAALAKRSAHHQLGMIGVASHPVAVNLKAVCTKLRDKDVLNIIYYCDAFTQYSPHEAITNSLKMVPSEGKTGGPGMV